MSQDARNGTDAIFWAALVALAAAALAIATMGATHLPGLEWIRHIQWIL